ncbi:MAG: hypothetical protein ACJA10_000710 [Oleispira sp.]|jgi:hypothetical protein
MAVKKLRQNQTAKAQINTLFTTGIEHLFAFFFAKKLFNSL